MEPLPQENLAQPITSKTPQVDITSYTILIGISIGLYVGSLLLPGLLDEAGEKIPGYVILYTGWMGLMMFIPSWVANITFIGAIATIQTSYGPKMAIATILLGLTSLTVLGQDIGTAGPSSTNAIVAMGSGFYVWMAAFVLMLFTTLLIRRKHIREAFLKSGEDHLLKFTVLAFLLWLLVLAPHIAITILRSRY